MSLIFTLSILLSAFLIFVVEPLAGKMLLPVFGGNPAVWNTSLVFFQGCLLIGYFYSYLHTRYFSVKVSCRTHLSVLAILLLTLPGEFSTPIVDLDASPAADAVLWLIRTLGLPFTILATTAPLLQYWYASASKGHDPYPLYAASNFGSFLALLAFPTLLEPNLSLHATVFFWRGLAVVGAICVGICALRSVNSGESGPKETQGSESISWNLRGLWLVASATGSALLMSLTLFITTDVAAIPLLWILPLALYLLTFVLTFREKPLIPHRAVVRWAPFLVIVLSAFTLTRIVGMALWFLFPLLGLLFVCCMLCHGALFASRPGVKSLGEFYLWVSLGGFIGGLFQNLAAPLIFDSIFELPILLALTLALREFGSTPPLLTAPKWKRITVLVPLLVIPGYCIAKMFQLPPGLAFLLICGIPSLVCYQLQFFPRLFAIAWGLMFALVFLLAPGLRFNARLLTMRNFFGVRSVVDDTARGVRGFEHGNILHGCQLLDPNRKLEPVCYAHREGPVGDVFRAFQAVHPEPVSVGIIGLGAGAMACYSRNEDTTTFLELDPSVVEIASNPNYFSFLRDCPGKRLTFVGDGRKVLEKLGTPFDMIIIDAFSSDAIPIHLLTREAFQLYLQKIKPGGWIVFHISNQFLDLEPVVSAVAKELHLEGCIRNDLYRTEESPDRTHFASTYVALTKDAAALHGLRTVREWREFRYLGNQPWTDDYSAVLPHLAWGLK